jgi:predicted Zn-dependent protease
VTTESDPAGTLEVAMKRASQLLGVDATLAAAQAQEILKAVPDYPPAVLLMASASRITGDPEAAMGILEALVKQQDVWAAAHYEHGLTLAALGRGDEAIKALQRTVELKPGYPDAWRLLADHFLATGDSKAADAAYARHIQCSTKDPVLQQAAAAMIKNAIPQAEKLLKTHLKRSPTDVPAMRMLAEVAVRCGRDDEAMKLLRRCLELAPGFAAARYNYATLLNRHTKPESALIEIERLLESDPDSPSYRNLCAVILSTVGEYERSSQMYAQLLDEYPANAKVWLSYGHVLKTEGRQEAGIDAYRKSIVRDPSSGEAYWSLANLKTYRFTEADLSAMDAQLADPELSDENRWHFHFALGKACEDANEYKNSFEHYAKGNALYRAEHSYNADKNSSRTKRLRENFSAEFFAAREGSGFDAPDPIFIVGMPRSGSTLLEQILSSHSAVEGTRELQDMISMAMDLREEAGTDDIAVYAEVLATKSDAELKALGEQYIDRTRIHRKTDSPFFIDKMPNNFLHVGMISLILPNAKIIDARRHPLGCSFSNFKQCYARGQSFSYELDDMGRFYYDYVELMAHFDEVLPGRVHRVFYEFTVADTESVVRNLLDYCGLPYESACLRFFENARPVRTASSEQVRQPIYREGIEQWQHYERWLDPLKESLGDVLEAYPDVPGN